MTLLPGLEPAGMGNLARRFPGLRPVVPGVYSVPGLGLGRVYCLGDADGITLIDAGLPGAGGLILRRLAAAGIAAKAVRRILVTHAHPDHAGGVAALQAMTEALVYSGAADRAAVEGRAPVPHRAGAAAWALARRTGWSGRLPAARVDETLGEGDRLPNVLGGLRVLAVPGHTPGHLAFWQPERRLLFCGDVIVNGRGLRLPSPSWTVDMAEDVRSVARLAALDPAVVCTGHGPPLTQGAARLLRAFAVRVRRAG